MALRSDSGDARLYFAAAIAGLDLGEAEGGVVFTKNNHFEPTVSAAGLGPARGEGGQRGLAHVPGQPSTHCQRSLPCS